MKSVIFDGSERKTERKVVVEEEDAGPISEVMDLTAKQDEE